MKTLFQHRRDMVQRVYVSSSDRGTCLLTRRILVRWGGAKVTNGLFMNHVYLNRDKVIGKKMLPFLLNLSELTYSMLRVLQKVTKWNTFFHSITFELEPSWNAIRKKGNLSLRILYDKVFFIQCVLRKLQEKQQQQLRNICGSYYCKERHLQLHKIYFMAKLFPIKNFIRPTSKWKKKIIKIKQKKNEKSCIMRR